MTFLFRGSSMAEHAAVNRRVVGSSPTRGADTGTYREIIFFVSPFFYILDDVRDYLLPSQTP